MKTEYVVASATAVAVAAAVLYRQYASASTSPAGKGTVSPTPPKGTIFIFGLGFSGARLATLLAAQGWKVIGTCRSEGSAEKHRAAGIEVCPPPLSPLPSLGVTLCCCIKLTKALACNASVPRWLYGIQLMARTTRRLLSSSRPSPQQPTS